jgi:hypothetical protein
MSRVSTADGRAPCAPARRPPRRSPPRHTGPCTTGRGGTTGSRTRCRRSRAPCSPGFGLSANFQPYSGFGGICFCEQAARCEWRKTLQKEGLKGLDREGGVRGELLAQVSRASGAAVARTA